MTAELVVLHNTSVKDPAATLRQIADEIEAGDYGEVNTAAVCLLGNTMEVFGAGSDADGPAVAVLLQAGVTRIVNAIESHGKP